VASELHDEPRKNGRQKFANMFETQTRLEDKLHQQLGGEHLGVSSSISGVRPALLVCRSVGRVASVNEITV